MYVPLLYVFSHHYILLHRLFSQSHTFKAHHFCLVHNFINVLLHKKHEHVAREKKATINTCINIKSNYTV